MSNLNVGAISAFKADFVLMGDQGSQVFFATGSDAVVNFNASAAARVSAYYVQANTGNGLAVPGINFKNEPPFTLSVGETFGVSNASNAATLKSFYLEQ